MVEIWLKKLLWILIYSSVTAFVIVHLSVLSFLLFISFKEIIHVLYLKPN